MYIQLSKRYKTTVCNVIMSKSSSKTFKTHIRLVKTLIDYVFTLISGMDDQMTQGNDNDSTIVIY